MPLTDLKDPLGLSHAERLRFLDRLRSLRQLVFEFSQSISRVSYARKLFEDIANLERTFLLDFSLTFKSPPRARGKEECLAVSFFYAHLLRFLAEIENNEFNLISEGKFELFLYDFSKFMNLYREIYKA